MGSPFESRCELIDARPDGDALAVDEVVHRAAACVQLVEERTQRGQLLHLHAGGGGADAVGFHARLDGHGGPVVAGGLIVGTEGDWSSAAREHRLRCWQDGVGVVHNVGHHRVLVQVASGDRGAQLVDARRLRHDELVCERADATRLGEAALIVAGQDLDDELAEALDLALGAALTLQPALLLLCGFGHRGQP